MDMSQYRELFLSEAREHLDKMNELAVALEQAPDDLEVIHALFREAHSIKGMAATMGYEATSRLAHHLEDALDDCRQSGRLSQALADRLLEGIDLLEGLVADIEGGNPEREVHDFLAELTTEGGEEDAAELSSVIPSEEESVAPADLDEEKPVVSPEPETFQILISLAKDAAMPAARGLLLLRELASRGEIISAEPDRETLQAGLPFEQLRAWFRTAQKRELLQEILSAYPDVSQVDFIEDRRQDAARVREEAVRSVRVRTDLLDRFVNLAGELLTQRHVLRESSRKRDWQGVDAALEDTGRLVGEFHHHVLRTRLMPLESVAGRLPRIVRDLGRKTGKQVTFRLIGGEVGIDRLILDELADPLVHLVRNAVDHGIADAGEVIVSARRERDMVLVEVRDNGTGMDPETLRRKAVEKGLLTAGQAAELSEREVFLLICHPGFSTADEVTETSGRGVGMDVVRSAVENLGGTLDILSGPRAGTRFLLRLPLSIAIVKLILVRCGGLPIALPVTRVQRIIEVSREQIQQDSETPWFSLEEERVPLLSLAELLGKKSPAGGPVACIVLTEWHGAVVGLLVDNFIGHRDAFVKPLGFPLDRIAGFSGAAIEGDGSVLFIVDTQPLLAERSVDFLPHKMEEKDVT